jgi:hypothetical protein
MEGLLNNMNKSLFLIFLLTALNSFTQDAGAQSYIEYLERINSIKHTLANGESISSVLKDKGYNNLTKKGGTIDKTLWKNGIPKKDVRKLSVGLEIILPYRAVITNKRTLASTNKENVKNITTKIDSTKKTELEKIFFLDLAYGVKYIQMGQSGVLGNADLSIISPNYLSVKTGFKRGDFLYYGEFAQNKFEMEANSSSTQTQLAHYSLGLNYKNFLFSAQVSQSPFFRNNSGNIEMVKLSTTSAILGYRSDIPLSTKKETHVKWQIMAGSPISANTNNNDSQIKKISGYNARGEIIFERELSRNASRQINYFIKQDFEYTKYKITTDWDTSKGEVDYTSMNSSFQIGLNIDF